MKHACAVALLLLALAPAGAADADAVRAYQRGLALRNGIGMAADAAAARRALDAAARAGVPAAMFTLAQMLAAGEGGARDEAASRAWIGRAAQAEYPEALQELALRETDPVQAAQLMREAAHALRHRAIERRGPGY
jgi:TPR repeat protein